VSQLGAIDPQLDRQDERGHITKKPKTPKKPKGLLHRLFGSG
jgi:hypothetical protein